MAIYLHFIKSKSVAQWSLEVTEARVFWDETRSKKCTAERKEFKFMFPVLDTFQNIKMKIKQGRY